MNLGVPPTEPKARTGEFTPPGISWRARSKSSSLRGMLEVMVPILSVRGRVSARPGQFAAGSVRGQQCGDAGRHFGAEEFDGTHHGRVRQGAVAVFEVKAVHAKVL